MRSGQQEKTEQARSCWQEEGLLCLFLRRCGECRIIEQRMLRDGRFGDSRDRMLRDGRFGDKQ